MKNFRKINRTSYVILGIGAIIMAVGARFDNIPVMVLGTVFAVAAAVYRVKNYRCPYCNAFLNRSEHGCCPKCGKRVDED